MIYIKECDNKEVVETLLGLELKAKGLIRTKKINDKTYKELFVTTDIYDIKYVINLLDKLIEDNPLKSNQTRDNKIKELENNQTLLLGKNQAKGGRKPS